MAENNLAEFSYAQLSMAAYADLSPSLNRIQYIAALMAPDAGFSQRQAEQFIDTYRVLDHKSNELGFSATVFQRIVGDNTPILAIRGTEPTSFADLASDALIALFGTSKLLPQYGVLTQYLGELRNRGIIPAGSQFSVAGHSLGGYLGAVLTGNQTYGNQIAQVYTYNAPGTGGVLLQWLNLLGLNVDSVNGAKITNINAYNGLSLIAGFGGQLGAVKNIFIENGTALHNHSIVTLTDSLALYNLFKTIDPEADIGRLTGILNAAGTAGGSSLEATLVSLRRLLQAPTNALTPSTPLDEQDRGAYYQVIDNVVSQLPLGPYVVESLVGQSAGAVTALATAPPVGLNPLAYRYALTQLNPFVIHGTDYDRHNINGELALFNAQTGTGTLTSHYLTDRALFLAEKIAINLEDRTTSTGNIHFVNAATNYEIPTHAILTTDRQFYFGGNASDTAIGKSGADRLYGGAGADVLEGNAGDDYLQGDSGHDQLTGGTGTDELWGGTGFDRYFYTTGDGNDRIEDSDATGAIVVNGQMLLGGVKKAGQTYWENADGSIRYEMAGTDLVVKLNGNTILTVNENFESGQMGIRLIDATSAPQDTGAPTGPFVLTVTLGSGELNGGLPENLSGPGAVYGNALNNILDSSISLNDAVGDLLDGGAGDDSLIGRNGQDYLIGGTGNDYAYVGDGDVFLGGDDADIMAGSTSITNFNQYTIGTGNHYADGGAGNDVLMGALGVDVLRGGEGNDQLWGENRPTGWIGRVADGTGAFISVAQQEFYSVTGAADYLDGGAGDDSLRGDGGDDVLIGGAGIDVLYGDDEFVAGVIEGDDFLDGGTEDDYLQGGGGQDVLMGGSGNDALIGDYVGRPALGADDILEGGAGNDQLVGGGGNDTLFGGADQDLLFGDDGHDVLDGGSGNDELQGGTEADIVWGGTGNDVLFGEAGNDQLSGDEDADLLYGGDAADWIEDMTLKLALTA